MPSTPLYFLEQTDFSLRLARCMSGGRPVRIDELKEATANEAGALLAALPADAAVLCAVRPKSRALHLATPDEAKLHSGLSGVRKFAQRCSVTNEPMKWFAAVQAGDGGPVSSAPWLLSGSADAQPHTVGTLASLTLKPLRRVSATFAAAGALADTVDRPVLLIEVGELASHALLVSAEGVLAAGAIPLDLARIAEAVQTELNLKFRGSAVKLFFNPDYDFSDVGPKIAARLGAAIQADLAGILSNRPAPSALFLTGLPTNQQWFAPQLASALGLPVHSPDLKTWSANTGVTFSPPELVETLSPSWFGLLHFLQAYSTASVIWDAEWASVDSPVAAATAPAPAPSPEAAKPVVPAPTPITAAPAAVAAATPLPTKPAAAETTKPKQPVAPATPIGAPKKPVEPVAAKSVTAPPPSAPLKAAAAAPKRRLPRLIMVSGLLIVVLLGGFFYFQSQTKIAAQVELEKQQAEQRIKTEAENARIAEQKAQQEAESQSRISLELAQQREEEARKSAEAAALAATAARLANARGRMIVTTTPAGAIVAVGNLPPQKSPATFSGIKIGTYPVIITLPHHDEMKLELIVEENGTTNPGLLTLVPQIGGLKITSGPGVADYELHPSNKLMVAPESRRAGKTPAALDDLAPGEYSVTLSREGWAPHTQIVSVARNATTYLRWEWPSATVKITSTPPGATVMRSGAVIGQTPLTLSDQPPGDESFEIQLENFEPVPLTGRSEAGTTLTLVAQFKPEDRIFQIDEIDRKPQPIGVKQPELPYYLTLENGRVELELTINSDGTPKNLSILDASNAELGQYCLAAVGKWRFKPAIKDGVPVNVKLKLPFAFKAVKS